MDLNEYCQNNSIDIYPNEMNIVKIIQLELIVDFADLDAGPCWKTILSLGWKRWSNGTCQDSTRNPKDWKNLTIPFWASSSAAAGSIPMDPPPSTSPSRCPTIRPYRRCTSPTAWTDSLYRPPSSLNPSSMVTSHSQPVEGYFCTPEVRDFLGFFLRFYCQYLGILRNSKGF